MDGEHHPLSKAAEKRVHEIAQAEARAGRVYRWIVEGFCILAVAVGLAVYQHGQDENNDKLAATIVAQAQVLSYRQDVKTIQSQRRGCRRSNAGLRRPLYRFLKGAERARRLSAAWATDPTEAAINRRAADGYAGLARSMVAAAGEFGRSAHSPLIDCNEAYTRPPPLPPATVALAQEANQLLRDEALAAQPAKAAPQLTQSTDTTEGL